MIRTLIIAALLATAAGIFLRNQPNEVRAESPAPSERLIAGAGRIEPRTEEIQVGADIYGRLRSVLVEEGQHVRKGEIVAILVNDDYQARVELAEALIHEKQAALERLRNGSRPEQRLQSQAELQEAEAVLNHAQADRERHTKLFQQELISRMEFDAAEQRYQVAKARVAAVHQHVTLVKDETRPEDLRKAQAELEHAVAQKAEANAVLAKTFIASPIDGTVLRKKMKAGESITALSNQPVITVGDCSRLRVRVDVDETDVARIKLGQTAWIRADAYGTQKFAAKVIRIGQILGRKNIRTDEPGEKTDQKILETMIELDPGVTLPIGLRVDAYINPSPIS